MSVSGLKAELKFLASIFDKNHERFRIVSWKLDELHCQFLLPPPAPPGSPHSPPPLTLHCNITVRRLASAPRSPARAKGALRVPGQKGIGPVEAPWFPGPRAGRIRPFPRQGAQLRPSLARARLGWEGAGGAFLRFSRGAGFGAGPSQPPSPRLGVGDRGGPCPRRVAMVVHSRPAPGAAATQIDFGCWSPGREGGRPSSFNALLFSQVSLVLLIHPVIFEFLFKEKLILKTDAFDGGKV